MSISQRLAELLAFGELVERPSSFTGYDTARTMIVAPEIDRVATKPFPATVAGDRLAELANTLDAFSEGGEFSVSEDCKEKPPETMLARTCPEQDEFWSIRVTSPEQTPGIRLLGGFAAKDTFIALAWHLREDMDFDDDVADLRERWRGLFGSITPFKGRSLDGYLSNYIVSK